MKIEEQKKAVRAGYDMDIIPFKDKFDKSLKLYSLMTTKPEEVEQREKQGRIN